MRDWGYEAHKAAAERLQQIYNAEDGDGEPPKDAGPWDGCDDCMIREILTAAWPIVEQAIRSGDFDPPVEPSTDVEPRYQGPV